MRVDPEVRRRALAQIPPKPAPHPVPWPDLELRQPTILYVTLAAHFAGFELLNIGSNRRGLLLWSRDTAHAFLVVFLTASISVAVAVLLVRRARRVRIRRAIDAAGRLTPDLDWQSNRTICRPAFLARSISRRTWLVVALLLVGSVILAFPGSPATFWPAVGSFVAVCVTFLAWVVFRGGAQVRFERFPYAVGERATFFVAMTAGSPRLEHARYLLRCIHPGSDRDLRPLRTVWDQPYDAPPEQWPGPEEFVEVTFDIPANLPGTALHGDPCVRWELLVLGRTRWGRLVETFVVPVYAAPSVGGPAATA